MHCISVSHFLSYRYIGSAWYSSKSWLERVVILGLPPGVTNAQVESKSKYPHLPISWLMLRNVEDQLHIKEW